MYLRLINDLPTTTSTLTKTEVIKHNKKIIEIVKLVITTKTNEGVFWVKKLRAKWQKNTCQKDRASKR